MGAIDRRRVALIVAYFNLRAIGCGNTGADFLNTSFNENEPIVMTPQEAIDTYLKTRMDVLALGMLTCLRRSFELLHQHYERDVTLPQLRDVLIVVVLLAVAGWFLMQQMSSASRIQDCVMSGRKNCERIDTGGLR